MGGYGSGRELERFWLTPLTQVLREQVLKEREENETLRERIRRLEERGVPDSCTAAAAAAEDVKQEDG